MTFFVSFVVCGKSRFFEAVSPKVDERPGETNPNDDKDQEHSDPVPVVVVVDNVVRRISFKASIGGHVMSGFGSCSFVVENYVELFGSGTLLCVRTIKNSSGQAKASASHELLQLWELSANTKALVFIIVSANSV